MAGRDQKSGHRRMEGKVCLITGATAGIGRAAAVELGRLGATVVLAARNAARGEEVRNAIASVGGSAEVLLADLSSLRQARALAGEFAERFDRLNVLINNAAVYTRTRTLTREGLELQLTVNHLAPFLLTNLLLPSLRRGAPSRIVTVSSEAHKRVSIDWEDLGGQLHYNGLRAYSQSKLANLLFTLELSRRLDRNRITANAVHPGVVGTELLFGGWAPLRLLRPFLRTPEQGASTLVYLAASPEVDAVSGRYFKDCRIIEPSRRARDPEAAERLWKVSEQLADPQS